jgi:hypothetical protein
MKKLIALFSLTLCCVLLFAQGQFSVPQAVTQAFKDGHPNHDFITWSMEGANYKANSLDEQHTPHITVYDAQGNVIRAERQIVSQDIPTAIVGYFNEKYPGDINYAVWMVEDKEGNRTYYSTHNDVSVRFDKDGNIVSKN